MKVPSGFDMHRLQLVEYLLSDTLHGRKLNATLDYYVKRLNDIRKMRQYYSYAVTIFAYGLFSGACSGLMLYGCWNDMLISFLLGSFVGD